MNDTRTLNRRRFIKEATATGATLGLVPGLLAAAEPTGKIKVGLIGCGSVSGSYLPNLTSQPFIEVVSVCDIIVERARKRAERFKVPNVYPNIDAMLAGAPFDLLVNTTSMPSHYPVNKKALEAKRHVWSEKPMALEVALGKELIELARRNGVKFWAAPTCVTSPQFKFMAETMASGKIGRVTAAHGIYGHGGPGWSAWFYEKGGGSLYDLGVYNVTTLTGLLGPAKEVVGMTAVINPTRRVEDKGEVKVEADENTMLIINHGRGVLSHVQTGFVYFDAEHAPTRERKLYTVDIMGTKGAMHLQDWDWGPAGVDLAFEGESELATFCKDPGQYNWVGGATYVAECLLTGKTNLITPEHGLHVLEVMNACHESQRTGRRVAIESTFKWPIFG
ncbi:MAG: Gfo/Idh/MocA family oxidoreductase [Chloroflexi bacterium]|nr:Gfo/Idh/MocA family oxidoreductase [Chloroflexota bacterium]